MTTSQSQLPLDLMQVDVLETRYQHEHSCIERVSQLFGAGDYIECLRAIDAAKPNTNLVIFKASCLTHLGIDHEKVLRMLTDVIASEPKNSFAYFELGLSLYINGDFEQALEPFRKAFQLNENGMFQALICYNNAKRMSTLFKQAAANFSFGESLKAVETLSLAALIDPENPSVTRKAKELIDSCLHIKEETVSVDDELSCVEALIKSNKLEDAANMMPKNQDSARCWYLKSFLSYKRAELTKASFYASKCLELNPHMNSAVRIAEKAGKMIQLLEVASEQMRLQHNDCAIALLTSALSVDRKNLRSLQAILFQRAVAKHNAGMEAEALEDYFEFEKLQHKSGWVVINDRVMN